MDTLNFNLIFCLIVQANLIFGLAGMKENVLATADVLGLGEKLNKVASVDDVWKL